MKIELEGTYKTPKICSDDNLRTISIFGRLIPENPELFFGELEAIVKNIFEPQEQNTLEIELEYFNTGAAGFLYNLFKDLKQQFDTTIVWRYESDDEDVLESGKEYESLTNLNFKYVQID